MPRSLAALCALALAAGCATPAPPAGSSGEAGAGPDWAIAIHGGAGVITPANMEPGQEAALTASLERALLAGAAVLREGGTSLDAVEAAVIVMEDDPDFNAGVGAVFTEDGGHELDASIMSGAERDAGAVAGVRFVKNPIRAARAVMENSPHVMFAGEGADAFAASQGLETVPPGHFDTERRRDSLERVLNERVRSDADRHGTVGAVAIDRAGNLAAATSTGGMTAKARGRVGDSPLIGAATYAQNGVCAVSATGHGEYFIRVGVARTICARIELGGATIEEAGETALGEVAELGGDGGVIIMGGAGEIAFVFNSAGMYRGKATPEGMETAIFAE